MKFKSLEGSLKNLDAAFEEKITSTIPIVNKQYIIVTLENTCYLSHLEFSFQEMVLKENLSFKISSSKDYVNWQSKNMIVKKNTTLKKFKFEMDLELAAFVKIEFTYSTETKPLQLKAIDIHRTVDYSVKIFNIKSLNATDHSVQIYWETDIETASQVSYGINNTGNLATEMKYEKKHLIQLDKLLKGTKYFFNIAATTIDKKIKSSGILTFKTTGIPLPLFNSVKVNNINWHQSELHLEANVPIKMKVKYGIGPDDLNFGEQNDLKLNTGKKIKIGNLKPLRKYYYFISAEDEFGNKVAHKGSFISAENNIALNKKVTGTFKERKIADKFQLEGNILNRITDGSLDYKTGMAVSSDPATQDQHFTIDLGKPQFVDKILLYFRSLCYPEDFTMSAALKKSKWIVLKKNINAEYGENGISDSGDPLKIVTIDANGEKVRYIKYFMKRGSPYYHKFKNYKFIQLFEAKVYPVVE